MGMKLAHLRLKGPISYAVAANLQSRLVTSLQVAKASSSYPNACAADPTVITAEFDPVYTCGRREINTVSLEKQAYLRADGKAEFYEALRGGQTTFHGPGQLVAYPIIDLKRHGLSPKCYVRLLEDSVIATCANFGIRSFTTQHPGVWTSPDHKIAAVGVHLRRNVSSHGIGLNINTDLWWFERIVACGLEGKRTTSFVDQGILHVSVDDVASVFASEFSKRLGLNQVDEITDGGNI